MNSFQITLTDSPADAVQRAQNAAQQNGSQFNGDDTAGSFSGHGVYGTYIIVGQVVTVTITSKPFYVSMGMIQDGVQKLFA